MILPVRCFSCNLVLASKYEAYVRECKKLEDSKHRVLTLEDLSEALNKEPRTRNFDPAFKGDILTALGAERSCCRRHLLGHVDLIEEI